MGGALRGLWGVRRGLPQKGLWQVRSCGVAQQAAVWHTCEMAACLFAARRLEARAMILSHARRQRGQAEGLLLSVLVAAGWLQSRVGTVLCIAC